MDGAAFEDSELIPQPGAHGFAGAKTLARHRMRGPFEVPGGIEGFSCALHQSVGVRLDPGHRVELIENNTVFEVILEEVRRATTSIHVILYVWRPCETSERIIEALAERSRAGVKVRIVVDPIGSEEVLGAHDFDRFIEPRLREAGCEVHYFRLLAAGFISRLLDRNHQKIVVVDGHVGITGGFGIWKNWEGEGFDPLHWRDKHVRVEGPSVDQMQLAFTRVWQESGGQLVPGEAFCAKPLEGATARTGFVTSHGSSGLSDAERMCRLAFAAATRRLWIANAYFTPPKAMLEQLMEKARRGLDVRILVPGPVHDVPIIRASQRSTYPLLLEQGVRIWEYQPSMMHAKTILVDDAIAVIGSTNLDALSLTKLGEGSLVVADGGFASALEQSYLRDLSVSRELYPSHIGRLRPLLRMARRATQLLGRDA